MGKHDMGSLTARWRLYFNMSVELLAKMSACVVVVSFCLAHSLNETMTCFQLIQETFGAKRFAVFYILKVNI